MSADARLEQILEEEGISTADGEPGFGGWLADVWARFQEEMFDEMLPGLGASAPWIAWFILAVAAVLALVILWQLVRFARAAGPRRARPEPVAVRLIPPPVEPTRTDVDEHLARGDAMGALRALWRWLSTVLEARGYARPAPDRTNRVLLGEVRRTAPTWGGHTTFARLTNVVDGHLYAGVPLDADAVRALMPVVDELAQ